MTFSLYGVVAFEAQYWDGSQWVTAQGGSVSGNNRVWRRISFPPVVTTKIRVVINAALDSYSRVVELEAWGASAGTGGRAAGADLRWLVSDQLGTPRIVVDETGSLAGVRRHDYLPFAEELPIDVGSRSSGSQASKKTQWPLSDAVRV